jgi:hypothetical protein
MGTAHGMQTTAGFAISAPPEPVIVELDKIHTMAMIETLGEAIFESQKQLKLSLNALIVRLSEPPTTAQVRQSASVHSKKKTYICPTCQKSFTQRKLLNDHIKAHTRTAQYGAHWMSHIQSILAAVQPIPTPADQFLGQASVMHKNEADPFLTAVIQDDARATEPAAVPEQEYRVPELPYFPLDYSLQPEDSSLSVG